MRFLTFLLCVVNWQVLLAQHTWSIDDELDLKMSQSVCSEPILSYKTESEVVLDSQKVNTTLTTILNCSYEASNPRLRFSKIGITLNIDAVSTSKGIAVCDCKRILKFTFNSEPIKEYMGKDLYFSIDGAVVERTKLPSKFHQSSDHRR